MHPLFDSRKEHKSMNFRNFFLQLTDDVLHSFQVKKNNEMLGITLSFEAYVWRYRKHKILFVFYLTHYSPVLLFYNSWKHQKTFRFSDIFRKATPDCYGLKCDEKEKNLSAILKKVRETCFCILYFYFDFHLDCWKNVGQDFKFYKIVEVIS